MSYDFYKANYDSINDALLGVNWNPLNFLNLDDASEYLYEMLHSICRLLCPVKKNHNKSHIPWMTSSLRNLRNRRDRARKKMSPEYSSLAAEFDMESKHAHSSYKNHIGQSIINDPKRFFRYVNSTRKTDGYPKTLQLEGTFSSNPSEISNMFAKNFQNAYRCHSDISNTETVEMPEGRLVLDKIHLSREKILNGLLSLKTDKSAGPDGFPNVFLVQTACFLLEPLYVLFNRSLSLGYFPSNWKSSYVTPIYKKGNRSDVGNYRCIAKLPAIPKLFESLVCDEMKQILEPILQTHQHGFVKGRSTVTNLSCMIHFIHEAFRDGDQVDVLYTDFSKAFDKVDHTLLLRKLRGFGVKGDMLAWLQSYLTGRTQYVKFRGHLSNQITVTSGVPQGSHLGPLLFNLYLVDMSQVLSETPHWILADDTKFGKVIRSTNDCISFQSIIDAFVNWCNVNLMDLNDAKCYVISFKRRGQLIEHDYKLKGSTVRRVEEIMDLGVLLDRKLEFGSHIEMICCKAYCMLAFIKRKAKEFDNMWVTQTLYFTLVRSILEYASLIWMPYKQKYIEEIESVQKQFLLFALKHIYDREYGYRLPPYKERLRMINMESLQERRELLCASFVFDVLRDNITVPFIRENIVLNNAVRQTRHTEFLKINQFGSLWANNTVFNRCSSKFNQFSKFYDSDITKETFKLRIKKFLSN